MYRLIIEHIVKQVLKEAKSTSANTKAKRKLLSSGEAKGLFVDRQGTDRIGNPTGVSDRKFRDILMAVLGLEDKDINPIGPTEKGSLSGRFITYNFPFEGTRVSLVLAGTGKEQSQRQETGLIAAINSIKGEKTIVFKGNNRTLKGVTAAKKTTGKGKGWRFEPYADIDLSIGGKEIKISAKGLDVPNLGGGGLSGFDNLNNPTVNAFVEKAYNQLAADYQEIINTDPRLKGRNLQGNKLFRNYYATIPTEVEVPILKGTKEMGGPIDYMYVGSMDVDAKVEGNVITVNGSLYTVGEFAEQGSPLYIRIAKRQGPCYFTTEINPNLDNIQVPKIFAIKPDGSGQTQSRLFVNTKATKQGDY
jgi:hypothetical protein